MPLRNDLLNPISGDNPSGASLRFDPITDKIKEARREEIDAPQGKWLTAVKTADLAQVIKLGGDVLANRSKDLQIAVWLVDAHIRREGFPILAPCLQFLRDLMDQFWDTMYPALEDDGDLEVRAAPLTWLGINLCKLDSSSSLGFLPIVSGKLSWNKYQESRKVGYEADIGDNYEKQQVRAQEIAENKITGEQFDEAADATPLPALKDTYRQVNEGLEALESLSQFCDEKFADLGDEAPSFVKTREFLEEIAQTVRMILSRRPGGLEEPQDAGEESASEESFSMDSYETPAEESYADADDGAAAAPVRAKAKSGVSFGEPETREDAGRQLVSICRFLRTNFPEDPAPYMMLRSFAWGGLMANAPLIDHSIIEAPPSELRVNLKRLVKENQWDQVLDLTEEAMAQPWGRTWLDMHRYVESALSGKGLPSMATTINKLLRLLLEMLPDLLELTLPDDTPSANQETRQWIEDYVTIRKLPPPEHKKEEGGESSDPFGSSGDSFGSSDSSSSDFSFDSSSSDTSSSSDFSFDTPAETEATPEPEPEAAAPEPPPEPEPYEVEANPPIMEAEEPPPSDSSDEFVNALNAVKAGNTAEGLAMITALLATERSGRARFRRRTQLAHLLMAAGKPKVAHPMLDQLATEIEERRLEDWEQSEAIAYPLELLLHCISPADDERRTALYTRICKLDPVRAVNCSF